MSQLEKLHDANITMRFQKIKPLCLVLLMFFVCPSGSGKVFVSWEEECDPLESIPFPPNILRKFKRAVVCSDSNICSAIGKNILAQNGSAVDSAIAVFICNGVVNPHALGIGGGFIMTVYIKEEGKAYTVTAKETVPSAATENMFGKNSSLSQKGPLSSAVPGAVRGWWEAHKRWGRLPWKHLFAPSLDLCKTGFDINYALHIGVVDDSGIKNDINLREQFYVEKTGKFRNLGDFVMPSSNMCKTLNRIAEHGGDELYNGSLSSDFLEDLKNIGSLITADDLNKYQPKIVESISVPFGDNGDVLLTSPPPSSGVILIHILNILKGYNFNATSIGTLEEKVLTYHRILEAFKYSYALRGKLGDPDYLDLNEFIKNATSPTYAETIRRKINDWKTSNNSKTYGAEDYPEFDGGTSHTVVYTKDGDAVSVTCSINAYFGAGYTTPNTGIVMNDGMDDFSTPGITNFYGLKPSISNFIKPGKKPASSMAPTIIINKDKEVRMVVGASGGSKITTSVAMTIMGTMWFGQTLKEAIDEPRIHHQLFPMYADYENRVSQELIDGLRRKGHGMRRGLIRFYSSICAAFNDRKDIYTSADFRKGGDTDGLI